MSNLLKIRHRNLFTKAGEAFSPVIRYIHSKSKWKYGVLIFYAIFFQYVTEKYQPREENDDAFIQIFIDKHGEIVGEKLGKAELNEQIVFWGDFYFLSLNGVLFFLALFLLHDGGNFSHKGKKLMNGASLAICFAFSIQQGSLLYREIVKRSVRILDDNILFIMVLGFVLFSIATIISAVIKNDVKRTLEIIWYRINLYFKNLINGG